MSRDSPRTECERRSRGAVRCSRMLYGLSKEPPHGRNAHKNTTLHTSQSGAPSRQTRTAIENDPGTLPIPIEAIARRRSKKPRSPRPTPTCCKPPRMFEGAQCISDRNLEYAPTRRGNPSVVKGPETRMILSCPYNGWALSREPRVHASSTWLCVWRGSAAAAPG